MAAREKSFAEVLERFRTIVIDEPFDLIVAIANGGIVPAGILAQRLSNRIPGASESGNDGCMDNGNSGGNSNCENSGKSVCTSHGIEVRLLRINLRDEHQKPIYDTPRLLAPIDFEFAGRRILLVDDRVKSGSTVRLARELLSGAAVVRTFAVNGEADYSLYNEPCFKFPWIIT